MKALLLLAALSSGAVASSQDYCDCMCAYKATRPATYEETIVPQQCDEASIAAACEEADRLAFDQCDTAEGSACVKEGCFF
ncbi:hypothetical protein K2X33_03455 [bacterium]|nr:hypothetical protein [bacterium]